MKFKKFYPSSTCRSLVIAVSCRWEDVAKTLILSIRLNPLRSHSNMLINAKVLLDVRKHREKAHCLYRCLFSKVFIFNAACLHSSLWLCFIHYQHLSQSIFFFYFAEVIVFCCISMWQTLSTLMTELNWRSWRASIHPSIHFCSFNPNWGQAIWRLQWYFKNVFRCWKVYEEILRIVKKKKRKKRSQLHCINSCNLFSSPLTTYWHFLLFFAGCLVPFGVPVLTCVFSYSNPTHRGLHLVHFVLMHIVHVT